MKANVTGQSLPGLRYNLSVIYASLCGDFIQQVIATGVQRRTGRIPQAELYHLIVHLDHLHIILKHRRFTVNA